MGSDHSVHSYIHLDFPSFQPGDFITGVANIYLNSSTPADVLSIRLVGKELTRWVRYRQYGASGYSDFYRGNFKAIDVSYPIWDFGGFLPAGQYSVPFRIETPAWLLPSYRYKGIFKKARIFYRVSAVVDDRKKTKAVKNVVWANSIPKPHYTIRSITEEANLHVRNFCFFKAGTAVLTANLNRNFVMPNDDLIVSIHVDNTQSRHTVNKMQFRLIRHLHMKVHKGFYKGSTKLIKDKMLGTTEEIDIPAGEILNHDRLITVTLSLDKVEKLWKYPSVSGLLIECKYTVDVLLKFNNWCGAKTYKISLPIEIFNGKVEKNSFIVPPPKMKFEWKPEMLTDAAVHSTVDITIPPEYIRETEMADIEEYAA